MSQKMSCVSNTRRDVFHVTDLHLLFGKVEDIVLVNYFSLLRWFIPTRFCLVMGGWSLGVTTFTQFPYTLL